MAVEEDPPAGVPDWVLTYGDMMSLLLTFFIMLVSMSEMKQDDKFQGVADSLEKQFGHDTSQNSLSPGDFQPRNTTMAQLSAAARAKRRKLVEGGARARAVDGEHKRVEMVRPGPQSSVGVTVAFADESVELSPEAKQSLDHIAVRFRGKPQIIEIVGHSAFAAPGDSADPWETAFARAKAVMKHLVEVCELEQERVRLTVAGPHDALPEGSDSTTGRARVEAFLREESPASR